MRFVPLAEGSSIDLDNGALDKSVRSDKFVVGSIVNDANDSRLASGGF